MEVKLLDSTTDPLFVISMAARRCYNSRAKDNINTREQFVKGLIKSGHETPLEFAYATFDIDGISRTCLAQLTRHRIASFCVESQRYVNVSEREVVIPRKVLFEFPESMTVVKEMKELYNELVNLGIPKEDARFLLPEGITTNLSMCMNFRELRHFLKLRLSKNAQWEIRTLSSKIYNICLSRWPWLVQDIEYASL